MPDVAGTITADVRLELARLVERCAPARARFRAETGPRLWELTAALWTRRAVEVVGALQETGGALDWLAKETAIHLAGLDRAPTAAMSLAAALGLDAGATVEAMLGPTLVYGSMLLTESVAYGHRSEEAATDLAAFLRRHFDEPEARALGLLAAASVHLRGARLLEDPERDRAAAAARALALATAQAPLEGRRHPADGITSHWWPLLYGPVLRASGRASDADLARFVGEAFGADQIVKEAVDATAAAMEGDPGDGHDCPEDLMERLVGLEHLVSALGPELEAWSTARLGDMAVQWLWTLDRRNQIERCLTQEGYAEGDGREPEATGGPPRALTVMMFGYCFNVKGRQRLIGVYKRLVRVGMELVARGHRVVLNVSGGNDYTDPLIERARQSPGFSFVDLHLRSPDPDDAEWNLAAHRRCIADAAPDLVLVGDVPLAGRLLEATLAAAQCDVPVVIAENLYSPKTAVDRLLTQGPLAHGFLLTGPSSHELHPAPSGIHYAPPFVPSHAEIDAVALDGLLEEAPEIVVLGYDPAVAQLGLELARALGPPHQPVVVITRDGEGVRAHAESLSLPPEAVITIPPVTEDELFALLRAARLAVVKAGYMQMTECLALGTPVVALRYRDFEVRWLPEGSQRFVVSARDTTPTPAVVNGARRLLAGPPGAGKVHSGPLGGASIAAQCLEQMAAQPHSATTDPAGLGIDIGVVERALRQWWSPATVKLTALRCMSVRDQESMEMFASVAHARCDGVLRSPALAIWLTATAMDAEHRWQSFPDERRGSSFREGRLIVEPWRGEKMLPSAVWSVS